jgi:hypothetical protein
MLDLFCGRLGWSKAFLARGWECIGVDLVEPPELPKHCYFIKADILECSWDGAGGFRWSGNFPYCPFDFICASSPCEQFSVHGLKCFFKHPPYPETGIQLFNHTREICETSGVPYVMENVRAAQQFVGKAANRCGSFYLWGNGVPPIMPQGITKGMDTGGSLAARGASRAEIREHGRKNNLRFAAPAKSKQRENITASIATIPPELANCVADYAVQLTSYEQ